MGFPLFLFATLMLGANAATTVPASPQQSFSTLAPADISKFKPFTFFASSAYCSATKTKNWSCGVNCDANPNFQPTASGGDGDDVQFWYVGFDPDLTAIIVAHQGTDPSKLEPLLTDADILRQSLDPSLFPGISNDVEVHAGFADAHKDTAKDVLAAVQQTMQVHNTTKVTVVGHSLGGAIALLDAVFLPLHIPEIELEMISYGMPRAGNKQFADLVDSRVKFTRITNKRDVVPIIPGRLLGYHHPSSEVHIESSDGSFVSCPGQDNPDKRCVVGDAKNVIEARVTDHYGPYDGVIMGC